MKGAGVKRSLTAIVMADVVGYSRLMGEDEAGTLRRLKASRTACVEPALAAHNGRLVDAAGDSLLMEFASVVDALEAAVAIQRAMGRQEPDAAPQARLEYRIGVNIGDVVVDNRALFGDAVNVAARLQALAPPGGLCLSRAAVEQTQGKLDIAFVALGPQAVKNIARPVEAFVLSPASIAGLPDRPPSAPSGRSGWRMRWRMAAAAATIVAASILAAVLWLAPDFGGASSRLDRMVAAREPGLDPALRARLVADYLALKPHRAFAFAPKAGSHWWTGDWPNGQVAEEKALERCQIRFGEPCLSLAIDGQIQKEPAQRDMARVEFSGKFDPEQIPGIRRAVAVRPEVAGYAQAAGPKAAAIHPRGVLTVNVGARTMAQAAARALRLCNQDDGAREADGACLLYALGDEVVLSRRLTAAPVER